MGRPGTRYDAIIALALRTATRLQKRYARRSLRAPWISAVGLNRLAISRQHFAKLGKIQVVTFRAKWRQIFFREPEQTHRWPQPFSMLGMPWMFELLLQMDERARRLNEPLEILCVFRRDRIVQPNLFQNIVRFVITLLVPAAEKCAVIRMGRDAFRAIGQLIRFERLDEPRNPLAFVHGRLNLTAPAMMGT